MTICSTHNGKYFWKNSIWSIEILKSRWHNKIQISVDFISLHERNIVLIITPWKFVIIHVLWHFSRNMKPVGLFRNFLACTLFLESLSSCMSIQAFIRDIRVLNIHTLSPFPLTMYSTFPNKRADPKPNFSERWQKVWQCGQKWLNRQCWATLKKRTLFSLFNSFKKWY